MNTSGNSGMPTFWESLKQPPITIPPSNSLQYALKYAALGWHIIPCYTIIDSACACGKKDCHSPGKHPMVNNGASEATNNPQKITEWFTKWPNANIGVATGKASGFFAVDIDIKHAVGKFGDVSLEQLEKDHGKLPDTVLANTGSGGLHYLFKYPVHADVANSTSRLGGAIDVRGKGGYIVVEPSLHITGHAYTWEASSDPLNDAILQDAPQWLLDLTTAKTHEMKPNNDGMYFQSSEWDAMSAEQQSEIMSALNFCPNFERDNWVEIGMSLHAMDSSIKGFEIWSDWSATCDKYDPQDQARVWASFNNKKTTKRNKESIFYIARKNGFISDAEKQKIDQTIQQSSIIIEQINNPTTYQAIDLPEVPKDQATKPPAYQVNNLFPVQVLKRLAGFINAGSSCYSEAATTQAVIAAASLIASRRYLTPQSDSCQLYVGISSGSIGSIGELRYTSRGVRQILQQCGLRRMIRDGRLSSTQALYKTLYQSPASIYLCDDYSAMIKLCQRQTTGGIELVLNTLTRIYDEKFIQLDSPDEAGLRHADFGDEGKPVIFRPSMSMLSLMHYSQLATFAKVSELGRGAVEQFLFAICDNDDLQFKEESDVQLPDELIDTLLQVRGISHKEGDFALSDIFNELAGIEPTLIHVQFADSLKEYDTMIDGITEDRRHRMFKNGARKSMRRLMTILAAFDNPTHPVATKAIMKWAAEYVASNLIRLLEVLEVVVSDDGKADLGQVVLDAIIKQGPHGIPPSKVSNYCRPFKALSKDKRQELIDKMLDDKDIMLIKIKQISGQTSDRLVYSKFQQ